MREIEVSKIIDVVEKLCDRAYIIDQGRILEEINIEEFKAGGRDLEEYFLSITQRVAKVAEMV